MTPGFPRITTAVAADSEAQQLRKHAHNEKRNKSQQYVLRHGVLFYQSHGLLRVFVPRSLRRELISEFHDTEISGHFGAAKTVDAIAQHYY